MTAAQKIGHNSRPRSATVGDVNNDKQLDIIVANVGTDSVGVFLGYETGTFQLQMTYSTGFRSHPYSVVVGDLNNDHSLDIVVANHGTNSVGILLGYGNGTFGSVYLHSLGVSRPVSATVANLNNDVYLDIIVANYDTSNIVILLGDGNKFFSIQTKYSTGYDSHPCSVFVTDLNRDNKLDIIVSNFGTNNVATFFGHGNGSFSLGQLYSTGIGSHPSTVIVDDLNGDNQSDIIVSNYGTGSVGAFLGYDDGTLGKIEISSIGSELHPYSMVSGDFNNDNIVDLAVATPEDGTITVLYGIGNATFVPQETYSTGLHSTTVFLVAGDFNNDNLLDLAAINNGTNHMRVLLRQVRKIFKNQTKYPSDRHSSPIAVALGDLNNDGLLDFAVANTSPDNIGIFLGYGNGTFTQQNTLSMKDGSPISIALGDFNNDNLLDIVVANRITYTVDIFLGYGNGTFQTKKTLSIDDHSSPEFVAVGDFNKDSQLDIAVANYETHNVGIFLGYGNGSFAMQMIFSTGSDSFPASIALGDFNNDDLLDIAVANYEAHNVGILLGYGNGSFATQMTFSTGNGSFPDEVVLSDFNNDNLLDIAVANYLHDNVGVFLGCGNGSFSKMMAFYMGYGSHPTSLATGDFNEDNLFDLVVSNSGSNKIGVLFGYGNGTFEIITTLSTDDGSRPFAIAAGKFNDDIWLDIVIANMQGHNVGVFLGLDNQVVADHAIYSTGSGPHPYHVVAFDLNQDSLLDLMVVNSAHDNIGILLGHGDGTFAEEIKYSIGIGSSPQFAVIGDFNNDFQADVAILNTMSDSVTFGYGYHNETFTDSAMHSTGIGSRPCFAAVGDLNNDNRLDLAIVNEGTNSVGVFLSFDYANFRKQGSYSTEIFSFPESVAVGDFNNDDLLDIVVTNALTYNIGILLGYGNGTFTAQKAFSTGNGSFPVSVALGDFNSDGLLDITVANRYTHNVGIFLGYGNGTFKAQKTLSTGNNSYPESVIVADFNNDSQLDIAVANAKTSSIGLFIGYGNGGFAAQMTFSTGNNANTRWITAGDFNNDSLLDIAVANSNNHNIGIFMGYGNGTFAAQNIFSTGDTSFPESVTLHDFNNDNLLDVAAIDVRPGNVIILLGYGNGSFRHPMVIPNGINTMPTMLCGGDLNGDSWPDIVVANYGANHVSIFFGHGDGSFTSRMKIETGSGSQPIAVAIGDVNRDNRSDIVVANFKGANIMVYLGDSSQPYQGMKTHSTGEESHPRSMAIADFNMDNRLDICVANYERDNIGILIGYGNGDFMKPVIYTTGYGSKPCSVAVGDFNEDSMLDIAAANAGTNNVAILLSHGNGTFSAATLFSTGDLSIPFSITVTDVNNDKYLDLAIANRGSKEVLVLFGSGYGTFGKPKSYLLGFGSLPYSLAVGDFNRDKWIDIAVANYGTDNVDILLQTCDSS